MSRKRNDNYKKRQFNRRKQRTKESEIYRLARNKSWHEKILYLKDNYIAILLADSCNNRKLYKKFLEQKELLEIKRLLIKLKRTIWQIEHLKK